MKTTDYGKLYKKAFSILGDLTPLKADCGTLCGGLCCKGDSTTGMLLFPHEESSLRVISTQMGDRLAVCNGSCNRAERPLSCRIFPFFPTVDEKGRVFVEKDLRAFRTCPLLMHSEEIVFDKVDGEKEIEINYYVEEGTVGVIKTQMYGKLYGYQKILRKLGM